MTMKKTETLSKEILIKSAIKEGLTFDEAVDMYDEDLPRLYAIHFYAKFRDEGELFNPADVRRYAMHAAMIDTGAQFLAFGLYVSDGDDPLFLGPIAVPDTLSDERLTKYIENMVIEQGMEFQDLDIDRENKTIIILTRDTD